MKLHDLHRPSLRYRLYMALALLVGVLAVCDAYRIEKKNDALLATNAELAHYITVKLTSMEFDLNILRQSDIILSAALTGGADVDEVLRRVVE